MTRWLLLLLPATAGCIIYDTDGKCWNCDDPLSTDSGGVRGDDTAGGDTDTVPDIVYKFVLTPSEAYPHDTIIAHLTESVGFDLASVTSAEFVGHVPVVLAIEPLQNEVIMTLQIPGDAPEGLASLVLHTSDGGNEYVENIFTVLPADPNHTGNGDTGGCP